MFSIVVTQTRRISHSQIDDTRLAGRGGYAAGDPDNYFREAAKTTPGLKRLADQLGEQFQKAGKGKESAKPAS